ncbi:unnamed protein product, partial [Discosporangium mesarthrocarpum]
EGGVFLRLRKDLERLREESLLKRSQHIRLMKVAENRVQKAKDMESKELGDSLKAEAQLLELSSACNDLRGDMQKRLSMIIEHGDVRGSIDDSFALSKKASIGGVSSVNPLFLMAPAPNRASKPRDCQQQGASPDPPPTPPPSSGNHLSGHGCEACWSSGCKTGAAATQENKAESSAEKSLIAGRTSTNNAPQKEGKGMCCTDFGGAGDEGGGGGRAREGGGRRGDEGDNGLLPDELGIGFGSPSTTV